MTPLFHTRNGLHPTTAGIVKAVEWTLMVNPSVPHFIAVSIYYQALQFAHACHGGYAGPCEEHLD